MYSLKEIKRAFQIDSFAAALDEVRPQGFYFDGEMHDFWEMVYVADGFATATADGRVYDLVPGQLLLHKPLEFHRIWSAKDSAPRLILLSFHAKGDMRRFENGFYTLSPTQRTAYEAVSKHMQTALRTGAPAAMQHAAAALELFLLELPETAEALSPSTTAQQQFSTIVEMMEKHLGEMLSVEELAALCHMSVGNLKRVFRMFADCGVAKYFLSLKMRHARQLLREEQSIAAVAAALGFAEPAYFCTVFKRETGLTPGEYRKSCVMFTSPSGIL